MDDSNIYPPIDLELAERRFKAIRAMIVGKEDDTSDPEDEKEKKED